MAKWIKAATKGCVGYGNAYRMCSDCKEVIYLPLDYKYCPMCGKICGFVFADRYVSELGNRLCKMHPEIDYVAMIDIDGCTVSYRTVKEDIDLGKNVASLFGGGGHPKAAGSEFSQSIKLKVIDEIFGQ